MFALIRSCMVFVTGILFSGYAFSRPEYSAEDNSEGWIGLIILMLLFTWFFEKKVLTGRAPASIICGILAWLLLVPSGLLAVVGILEGKIYITLFLSWIFILASRFIFMRRVRKIGHESHPGMTHSPRKIPSSATGTVQELGGLAGEKICFVGQVQLGESEKKGLFARWRSKHEHARADKTISFDSGIGRSGLIETDRVITPGKLTITNKRVVFQGDNKRFDISFLSLSRYKKYTDGIELYRDPESYMLLMDRKSVTDVDKLLDNFLKELKFAS